MDLFSAVMSTTLGDTCKLRPNEKDCFVTAGTFPEAKRDKLLFLDIGSNHGFFTGYAAGAAPWLTAYAFEPQPQCAEFIEVRGGAGGGRGMRCARPPSHAAAIGGPAFCRPLFFFVFLLPRARSWPSRRRASATASWC